MSNTLILSNFGFIISDKDIGEKILSEINNLLEKNEVVNLDFEGVKSMATFCSKQIFGYLYIKLQSEHFFKRLIFKNVNEDVKLLIKIGIQNALEELE